MSIVLFLNHTVQTCGVYQYGVRVYDIVKNSKQANYIYKEINTFEEYMKTIAENANINAIIYNYHQATMPWLHKLNIQNQVVNISLAHESPDDMFDVKIDIDPSSKHSYTLPRPLFENIHQQPFSQSVNDFIKYNRGTNVPIFGSFGFGFMFKGFHRIVELVNQQFDNAIIKFIIPDAFFDPHKSSTFMQQQSACYQRVTKPGIQLMISREFHTNNDLLLFLRSNTMNMFMYDRLEGRGISSALDYAMSVDTPLGISNSYMFRHVYNDCVDLDKCSIMNVYQNSPTYFAQFRSLYSNAKLIAALDNIILSCRQNSE